MKKAVLQQALVEAKFQKSKESSDLCEALDVVQIIFKKILKKTSSWNFLLRHAVGIAIRLMDEAIEEECGGPGYVDPFNR